MQKIVFAWVALLALAATAGFAQSGTMMAPPKESGSGGMMSDSNSKAGSMMSGDSGLNAMGTSHEVAYTDLAAARRLAEKGPTVLLFAADWDAGSRTDLADISANGARLADVTVVVADYDKAADLKARYGIAHQDTYVQIDSSGKPLAAWSGGGVEGILAHVARM